MRGREVILLLAGDDKRSQARDIKKVFWLAQNLSELIMTKIKATSYDVAEHLRASEEMAAYLEACMEKAQGDAVFIPRALGNGTRAKGMSQVARDAGLSRESLYKVLFGERYPSFVTILKVTNALGITSHAEPTIKTSRDNFG